MRGFVHGRVTIYPTAVLRLIADLRKAGPFGRILVTSLGMDYGAGRQVTAAFDTPPVKVCVFLIL